MGLAELSQAERLELRRKEILHLVDWELSTDTLHLSDRPFRYKYGATEILYEPYVREIVGLDKALSYGVGSGNERVTIVLFNHKWGSYDYLIQLTADQPFTRSTVTIHELRVVEEEETFSADERVTLCKLAVERVERITRESFLLVCSSRIFDKRGALGLEKVNTTDFPNADPDAVGQYRNILYGSLEHVPCRAVVAGWSDVLAEDLTASETSVDMSGAGKIDYPAVPFVMQIDEEKMNVTGRSGNTLTVTRGYDGTTAVPHDKGARAFEVLTEYVYEIAKHPLKAVNAVYVDNVRQSSGFTAYTGQSGDEHPSHPGRAVVAFSAKPYVRKQVNLDVSIDAEHGHSTSTGSHSHTTSASVSVRRDVSGVAGESNVTNASYSFDGSDDSYALIGSSGYLKLSLESGDLGTLTKTKVHIILKTSGGNIDISACGVNVTDVSYPTKQEIVITNTSPTETLWNSGSVTIYTDSGVSCEVYEVWAEYFYTPVIDANPADGVSTSRIGSTSASLSGNSSAEVVVGMEVTVDVEGYQDDASGTYTGTPNALIERPDHVFKHLLVGLLGFASSEIGNSFATSGSSYATEQHKFAFILHDVATDATRLLQELARQCRSLFFEWGGKFELVFLPDSPSADHTILEDEWQEEPVFAYTSTAEIKNKMRAFYRRDYRSVYGADAGPTVISGVKEDVRARGYMDMLENTYGDGDLAEDLMLNAVRTSTHAQDVLDYWHGWKKQERLTIEGTLSWEAMRMAPGDHFSWADPVMGTKTYRLERLAPDRAAGRVRIQATAVD